MVGPLIRRQYGARARGLAPELRGDFLRRYNALGALPPATIPLSLFAPTGARSDAQGHGQIAVRALFPKDVSISTHLSNRFIDLAFEAESESPIYLIELAATILTSCEVDNRSDGYRRTCVLCIDNKAALESPIKGSPSSVLGDVLVNVFRCVAARRLVVWRFEYANTKSNAADPPSRVCNTSMEAECALSSWETPPNFPILFSPRIVLRRESTLTCK